MGQQQTSEKVLDYGLLVKDALAHGWVIKHVDRAELKPPPNFLYKHYATHFVEVAYPLKGMKLFVPHYIYMDHVRHNRKHHEGL